VALVNRLVDRFGRTGVAALASLAWALPMAAWAGSADLTPIDQTAYPWVALGIGLVMLAAWLILLTRLGRAPASSRPHRLDFGRMSGSERRWMLALVVFATGLIAWLNGAGTVDWTPLAAAIRAGKPGPIGLAIALFVFLAAMLAGIALSWRRSTAAYRRRAAAGATNLE
jgi:hypothetical protein